MANTQFNKNNKENLDKKDDKKTGFEEIFQEGILATDSEQFKSPVDIARFASDVVDRRKKEITDDVMEKVKKAQDMATNPSWIESQIKLVKKATEMYNSYQESQDLPCCKVTELTISECRVCNEEEL